jgi:betaine lipid synthase
MIGLSAVIPRDPLHMITIALCILGVFLTTIFLIALNSKKDPTEASETIQAYFKFFYACFVKPHSGDGTGRQQDALVRPPAFYDTMSF